MALVYSFNTYISRTPGGFYYVQGVTDPTTNLFTLRVTPVNSGVPIDVLQVAPSGAVTIPSLTLVGMSVAGAAARIALRV